jgi:hypothetical protein
MIFVLQEVSLPWHAFYTILRPKRPVVFYGNAVLGLCCLGRENVFGLTNVFPVLIINMNSLYGKALLLLSCAPIKNKGV